MLADAEVGVVDDIVDTTTYALQAGSAASARLVAEVRSELTQRGAVTLPGFLQPAAIGDIAGTLNDARRHIEIRRHYGTVYARTDLESKLDADDPRCAKLEWDAGHVTRDMIAPHCAAHRLYVSPMFKSFIAGCVGLERVFEYADPLAGLVATVLPPGGAYPWHYDTNEFVATIVIQKPDSGGHFVYRHNLRSPGNENLTGLRAVLDGQDASSLQSTNNGAGDLQLFLGRYSLHQVTAVRGQRERLVLVLSYADRPGVIGPLDRTRSVYGRVTEAHLLAAQTVSAHTDGLIL